MMQPKDDDLYGDIERRALNSLPDEPEEELDLLSTLGAGQTEALEATLGAYVQRHDRVPAFEGADGQPYTVDIDTEPADDGYVAFLVFIRWAATGAGIMDHVESGDVAHGATEEDARNAAFELSLYEIKAELDRAIERRRQALEDPSC